MSDTGTAGSCRQHFRSFNSSPISRNIELSVRLIGAAVFASMLVSSALVILTSICRLKLFESKYRSFAPLTVYSMATLGWIVASVAYSKLNSFSITFCGIVGPNRLISLIICSVTLLRMVAILQIINNK